MWQPHAPSGRHEARGQNTANSRGTTLTSGSAAKGSWVNLGSATDFAYEAISVFISRANADDFLVDIGISDGTNRFVIVPDIRFSGLKVSAEMMVQIYIPVHIPAGAQISARTRSSVNTNTIDCSLTGHDSGLGGAPGFSRCVALYTPTGARGPAIDPGGTANTKGSWTEMVASTAVDVGAVFGLIGTNNDVARAATGKALIDIGIGAGGSEQVLYPNALVGWETVKDGPAICPRIPIFAADVPAGTRIAARAACRVNTAGDRTVDLALYGLVK